MTYIPSAYSVNIYRCTEQGVIFLCIIWVLDGFRNCLSTLRLFRLSSKTNCRRLMGCVNMLYMFKVSHHFCSSHSLFPLLMCKIFFLTATSSKTSVVVNTRAAQVHDFVSPKTALWTSCCVFDFFLMRFFFFSFNSSSRWRSFYFVCVFISLCSTNLASWGQDPAVPGAVSELCHLKSQQRRQS